jgi:hypothetical protein
MIEEQIILKKMMQEVRDMFILQATAKGLQLTMKLASGVPYAVVSDERRLK